MFARVIGLPPAMQSSSFSSMEIRELAERILFGTTLEEKLVRVDRLQDTQPGKALTTPDKPGRPAELALDRWGVTERVPFADVRALEGDEDRGLVLHFFANHELLAAELMALVLLKFPDAPARFRRGVAQTMKDEQEHVRLYLDRMQDAGVTFGQIPVSDFFWRAIAPMPSPMDFVTCLSLTLEQANLDYAPHYQQLFGELGDADTAALLGRIYKDEIGHVKHGLNWFNTWRSPTQSEWASFQAALGFPLSPSRAKGIGFNREGRRQAGFSAEFIDELDIFAHSHGRCPDLYWFNPLCDLAAGRDALFTPNSALIDVAHDLAMVSALCSMMGAGIGGIALMVSTSSPAVVAVIGYGLTLVAAVQVPKVLVAPAPATAGERAELRQRGILTASFAVGLLRAVVGFTSFLLAFEFRGSGEGVSIDVSGRAAGAGTGVVREASELAGAAAPAWHFGLVLGAVGIGAFLAAQFSPRLRRRLQEEKIIRGVLFVGVSLSCGAVWLGGLPGAVVIGAVVATCSGTAKLAFDSLVQRDAPGANHGRSFARFEGRFQLAWAVGGFMAVFLPLSVEVGYVVIAGSFAAALTWFGLASPPVPRIVPPTEPQGPDGQLGFWRREELGD